MTSVTNYSYTTADVERAFGELLDTSLPRKFAINEKNNLAPKLLIVAGVQGSGKTFLLENTLIPSGHYADYFRLYLPEYREKHPQYKEMIEHGAFHAYEHTEQFIWALGSKIFTYAFSNHCNIIMETALDNIGFAAFPREAARIGYQFEIHLIGCKKEFAHLSTVRRALDSLEENALERFVEFAAIESSMGNAQSILTAFEEACLLVPGSEITMYERGFGKLRNRQVVCHSRCDAIASLKPLAITHQDGSTLATESNPVRIERTAELNVPCSYNNYALIVNAPILSGEERGETVKESHLALSRLPAHAKHAPFTIFNDLYAYIMKYVNR